MYILFNPDLKVGVMQTSLLTPPFKAEAGQ
jgi:hypothetical protein